MPRLLGIAYILVAPVLMGVGVTALLTVNRFEAMAIAVTAVVAALVAIPIAWIVAKNITAAIGKGR